MTKTLIVEDDPTVCETLPLNLHDKGFEVVASEDDLEQARKTEPATGCGHSA